MFTLFSANGLCKFVQNILTNIWSVGKRADLKFGEMSYLLISYNIIISWFYTRNGFQLFFYCVTVQPIKRLWPLEKTRTLQFLKSYSSRSFRFCSVESALNMSIVNGPLCELNEKSKKFVSSPAGWASWIMPNTGLLSLFFFISLLCGFC